MFLPCKSCVYTCMTLTLLPSCCTPNPWWNSMCLKWRIYLPPNEWLRKLNFTGLKQYQLEAWMPSEGKKKRQGICFPWRRVPRTSLMYHLPLISVRAVKPPFCNYRWSTDSLQVSCPRGLTQPEAAPGFEEKFGSLVLPGLYDRQEETGNSWSSRMLAFNLCWTMRLVCHRIS